MYQEQVYHGQDHVPIRQNIGGNNNRPPGNGGTGGGGGKSEDPYLNTDNMDPSEKYLLKG